MARDDPHFRLRLPTDLKEMIETEAKASGRSINAEIVHRLQRSFTQVHASEEVTRWLENIVAKAAEIKPGTTLHVQFKHKKDE